MTLLPDEVSAAAKTVRDSYAQAAPHRAMKMRYVAFYLALFAIGCWVGAGLQVAGLVGPDSGDFWRSALSVLAVLSGFMIATLSFTGKADVAKSISLEQLCEFSLKSNHLLFSQLATLFTHLGGITTISIVFLLKDSCAGVAQILTTVAFGLALTSLFRSLLVPVQIIELHRFAHAALIAEKKQEVEKASSGI